MYKLNTHTGATICFVTMGDALHHLNSAWAVGDNPYLGNAGTMNICHAGIVYPIVQASGMSGLAPSFARDFSSAYEHIAKWLDEVMPYAKDATGTIKPPQLMKREQWMAIHAISNVAFGCTPVFSSQQLYASYIDGEKEFTTLSGYFTKVFFDRFGYGHNGPIFDGQSNCRHETHVAYALARGESLPDEVLVAYRGRQFTSASPWFSEVVHKPFLRGRFKSVSHLAALVQLLKVSNQELTEENTPAFVDALQSLEPTAGRLEVDNVLYSHGYLTLKPQQPMPTPEDYGLPYNEFAGKLRERLGEWKWKHYDKLLEDRRKEGRVTAREFDWEKINNASWSQRETFQWANRVAKTVAELNLPGMLSILDGPANDTSKKAVEQEFNVKLRGVSVAQRRRSIFAVAGFVTDEAYRAEEARLAQEHKARSAEREFQDARTRALDFNVRMDGSSVMTCAAYVECLVEKGHVEIGATKKGAAKAYYLMNPLNRESYPICRANGSYEYARLVVERLPA